MTTTTTPIVLMGYYNPIYIYGVERFLARRARVGGRRAHRRRPAARGGCRTLPAGVAGRAQLHPPRDADHRRQAPAGRARQHVGLRLLRLGDGHHRCIAIPDYEPCRGRRSPASSATPRLPVAVGFGVKTPESAAEVAGHADARGGRHARSSPCMARSLDEEGRATPTTVDARFAASSRGLHAGFAPPSGRRTWRMRDELDATTSSRPRSAPSSSARRRRRTCG